MSLKDEIPSKFFNRPVLDICPELLGHYLCTRIDGKIVRAEVFDIEAYDGPEDKACHASKGKTLRNEILFGDAGKWYVYLCYGVHWLLNVVTGPVDYPAAILIRGVGEWTGPGKLTKALKIDKRFNTQPAANESHLWFEYNPKRSSSFSYKTAARIGVDYAGEWAKKPYRFIKDEIAK